MPIGNDWYVPDYKLSPPEYSDPPYDVDGAEDRFWDVIGGDGWNELLYECEISENRKNNSLMWHDKYAKDVEVNQWGDTESVDFEGDVDIAELDIALTDEDISDIADNFAEYVCEGRKLEWRKEGIEKTLLLLRSCKYDGDKDDGYLEKVATDFEDGDWVKYRNCKDEDNPQKEQKGIIEVSLFYLMAGEKVVYHEDDCVFVFEKDSEYDPNYVDEFGNTGDYGNMVNILFYPSEEAYENHALAGFSGDIHVDDLDGLEDIDIFSIGDTEGNGTFREIAQKNKAMQSLCKDDVREQNKTVAKGEVK